MMLAEIAWPPGERPHVFVCGPTPLVESVAADLVELGHDPALVKAFCHLKKETHGEPLEVGTTTSPKWRSPHEINRRTECFPDGPALARCSCATRSGSV